MKITRKIFEKKDDNIVTTLIVDSPFKAKPPKKELPKTLEEEGYVLKNSFIFDNRIYFSNVKEKEEISWSLFNI